MFFLVMFFVYGCCPGVWLTDMVYNGPEVYNANFSRNGKKIAFVYAAEKDDQKLIFIANVNGKSPELLAEADVHSQCTPIFTPDDKAIIFYSSKGQFFKVDIKSMDVVELSEQFSSEDENKTRIHDISVSDDCKVIKFQKDKYGLHWSGDYRPHLFIYDVAQKDLNPYLFPEKRYFDHNWGHLSPDGKKVAFCYKNALCILNLKSRHVETFDKLKSEKIIAGQCMVAFSPDSNMCVYTSSRGMYLLNLNSKKHRCLCCYNSKELSVDRIKFAPDGKAIYFNLNADNPKSKFSSGFYCFKLHNGGLKMIMKNQVFYYKISPDSKNILYRSREESTSQYYMISADGKDKRKLILRPRSYCPLPER